MSTPFLVPPPTLKQRRRWARYNAGIEGVGHIDGKWPLISQLTEAQAKDQLCDLMDALQRVQLVMVQANGVMEDAGFSV